MPDKYKAQLDLLYNVTEARTLELSTYSEQTPATTSTPNVQPSSSYGETIASIVILCFFSVIGTLGNGLVLYVFTRTPSKLASTIFILALAGTDFVTCLVIIPFTVITIHVDYFLPYDSLCKIYQFLITCPVPLSAFIMVAIAVDRYFCICHPFSHIMTVRRAKIVVIVLGSFAVILGLITSLGFSIYERNLIESANVTNVTSSISEMIFLKNGSREVWINGNEGSFSDGVYKIKDESLDVDYKKVQCQQQPNLFSAEFIAVYQKIYSAFFLCSLLIVLILYCLIYSSVTRQRAKWRAQKMAGRVKQVNTQCQTDESTMPLSNINKRPNGLSPNNHDMKVEMEGETVCTKLSVHQENGSLVQSENQPIKKAASVRKHANGDNNRERSYHDRLANIKTALMLFIVTIVFIIAFLPAWLMAHQWLTFSMVVFYTYFAYNVANPVIYAFMNQMFRENMCKIFSSCKMYINTGSR